MKWLSNRGAKNQKIKELGCPPDQACDRASNTTSQIVKLVACLFGMGTFLSGDVSKLEILTLASVSPQQLNEKISHIAADISVRILAQDFVGSGFIVKREDSEYIVVTNQHVLRAGDPPFQVRTPDGQVHDAQVVSDVALATFKYDLAILKFHSSADYHTARIGNSLYLEVGEPVFAAGFPDNDLILGQKSSNLEPLEQEFPADFTLKSGRVAIILNQALEEGYQIGYTNDVKKGMSGGPLLNSQGEVVGVNGKHAYPLWESPEVYQDGTEPCPALQGLITRSSLAIPIEKTMELNPQLASLKLTISPADLSESNLSEDSPQLVRKMQAEAEKTVAECQNERQIPLSSDFKQKKFEYNASLEPSS